MKRASILLVLLAPGCSVADEGWKGYWSTYHGDGHCAIHDTYAAYTDHALVGGTFSATDATDFETVFTLTFHDADIVRVETEIANVLFERHLREEDGWIEFRLHNRGSQTLMDTLASTRNAPIIAQTESGEEFDISIDRSGLVHFNVAKAMFDACVKANGA